VKYPDKNNLQAIYVLPGHQGKGIGSNLWAEALKFFDSTKDTTVEVVEYNSNAIDFYKRLGFEETGKKLANERLRMKSGSILPEIELVIKVSENREL
jgi:ribosomal protein S18 acetylase RimI-like enzyme